MAAESHRTLIANPTTLEVGVQSGTQGWLKIRAEAGSQGQVTASLAAASDGGQELLRRQLPALNAYLHSEQLAVNATVSDRAFASATNASGGMSPDAGTSGSYGNAAGTSSQSDGQPRDLTQQNETRQSERGGREMPHAYDPVSLGGAMTAPKVESAQGLENGRWLNVRA